MTTKEEVYEALKYRIVVGDDGTRRYYNNLCQLHREYGPAVEWDSGANEWWLNGVCYSKHEYIKAGGTP